jgi:1,2-diacylglycerol 3-beta-glucosyltransferase
MTVMIPARNEAAVLPALLGDLAAQDYVDARGAAVYRIVVIDDRSTDGTGDAARDAIEQHGLGEIARVVRRSSGAGGKAAALAEASQDGTHGGVVAVFDADARLTPDVLSRAARHLAAGTDALTARRRVAPTGANPGRSGWMARILDDEQTLDGILQATRWSMGGCTEFRGDGMFVRQDRLVAVGGWAPAALTEDLELSTRLAARLGIRVAWGRDVVVWEEAVPARSLFQQRLRWSEGTIRRQLEHTLAIWGSPELAPAAKLDYSLYGLQTIVAPIVLGLTVGSLRARTWRTFVWVGGAYVAGGLLLGATALASDVDRQGRPQSLSVRLWRSLLVTVFTTHWLVVLPVAWLRTALQAGPSTFAPTPHDGLTATPAPLC